MSRVRTFRLAALLVLAACGALEPRDFAAERPVFEPERFFAGPVRSWGVIENRAGEPTQLFETASRGRAEGEVLVVDQEIRFADGSRVSRTWRLRREGRRYEATASNIDGIAAGEADGNAFRWEYTLQLEPGNPLKNVHMTQWMYLLEDGSLLGRATLRKLGVEVAGVTEHFRRMP